MWIWRQALVCISGGSILVCSGGAFKVETDAGKLQQHLSLSQAWAARYSYSRFKLQSARYSYSRILEDIPILEF